MRSGGNKKSVILSRMIKARFSSFVCSVASYVSYFSFIFYQWFFVFSMLPNGPAIWGGCVTRRKHRVESWYFSQKAVTVQGGYGALFASHGTNFIEHYACRGTSLIGAASLSRYRIFIGGTGAVSWYKLSRSQKSVTVQDFNCG